MKARNRRWLWASAFVALAGAAVAQDYVVPSVPDAREFDFPRGSIGFFSTVAIVYRDDSEEVMYGYIFGTMDRDAVFYFVNDQTGARCEGQSARQPDRSGLGQLVCTRNGQAFATATIVIEAGVYGRMNGVDAGTVEDMDGNYLGTSVTEWNAWQFPDPAAVMGYFDR